MTLKEKRKDYNLRKRYGIDLKEYKRMLRSQKYRCLVCGKHTKECKYGLCVDHNHRTGHIRGLLCTYCNRRIIGRMGDDRKRMEGLVVYISKQLREDKAWH